MNLSRMANLIKMHHAEGSGEYQREAEGLVRFV